MAIPQRRVAHLDMDAFYASVELLRYPELIGVPVAIGGRRNPPPIETTDGRRRFARLREYSGRGVLTTATYEARALGVHSGMGVMQAARLAPDAILLPADFDAYRRYSQQFKSAVAELAPKIENRGIDEIYIDISELPDDSRTLALRIKQAVRAATGLSCSIGVAPNKLLAKICSELGKPDGLTILDPTDIPDRIWPLPVATINGIGPKATQKLATLGITRIADLAHADPDLLRTHFGPGYAAWLHRAANGIDDAEVITRSERKSISRETTFERDLHPKRDREMLAEIFTKLCAHLAKDLDRSGLLGRTIGIKLRYDDFTTVTRARTLPAPTADSAAIRRAAGSCLKRVGLERKLRLLGVRATGLLPSGALHAQEDRAQPELPLEATGPRR